MRNWTLPELDERLRSLLNIQNDRHVDRDERYAFLVSAVQEAWDLIVKSGLAEQYVKKVSFNTVANQMEYEIEPEDGTGLIDDGDFYKVSAIYVDEGNGHLRSIERINPAEILYHQAPQAVVPMWLYYIPAAPTFKDENEDWDEEETFDGINGWEELVLQTAALNICQKKGDDYNQYYRRKKDLEQRIATMGNTDWSGPTRVVRRARRRVADRLFFPFSSNVTAWGIRGGKLELYGNTYSPY